MPVINANISSIQAQNSLRVNSLNQATAMERLSSGMRINTAKDDAAGLAIATRMTANIRGVTAAVRNANDGISLMQTAEGALSQIGDSSSYTSSKAGAGVVTANALAAGDLSINAYQVGATVSDGVYFANANASGIAKAPAINAVSGQSGVSATVSSTSVVCIGGAPGVTSFGVVLEGVTVNGVAIGRIGPASGAGDRATQTAAAVNSIASQTGVTVTVNSGGDVALNAADGRNITVYTTVHGCLAKTGLSSINLQASRSRIMDTYYAKESTSLAKSQIIAQAATATAMLAQANQAQQSVLALLK